ncbi:MAG TPA: copper-translocating P-type ATPase [Mogibacterium sp.]|nr:copper-translocating P-type ATPase [Mogibacterium sp.]
MPVTGQPVTRAPVPVANKPENYREKIINRSKALEDTETPKLRRRLVKSVGLLLVLMYFSMGYFMWDWPIGSLEKLGTDGIVLIQMILATVILYINRAFFVNGFKGALRLSPNMDTLVAMGAGVSYLWSVWHLYLMFTNKAEGPQGIQNIYFESAAMIVTLITVGKMLEAFSKGKTTNALKELIDLVPETATVERDDEELIVGTDYIRPGEVVIIKPGEKIPVDGEIIEGHAAVDEAALTGESLPVDKGVGDSVSAATINKSGYIRIKTKSIGEDTMLAKIIDLVSDAAATKAPISRTADKIAGIFVPVVIGIAILVFAIWMISGQDASYALTRAIAVLVISCPCALGLATPVAIMVSTGVGARNGILFKTAASIEETGRVEIVALDKTGTITGGEPAVTDVYTCRGVSKDELLIIAAALEARSDHPIAKAVSSYCRNTTLRIADFKEVAGNGVKAFITEGSTAVKIIGGNAAFLIKNEIDKTELERIQKETEEFSYAGKTSVFFAKGGQLLGVIAVADSIRPDSRAAISELKAMGIHTVMLTGDKQSTAEAIASETGVDEVIAEVMPDEKEEVIRGLMENGKTAMVGDGINDAPALTRADVGIAIGAGTDVAVESADVVLVNSNITDVVKAIKLGRKTLKNIYENLFWAFFYNILLIPLAAGAFTSLFGGWNISPMWAAGAMSISSFCVCMNALRINLIKF